METVFSSQIYNWIVGNNITAAATPATKNYKVPGFDINIVKLTGSLYNTAGAILKSTSVRDKVLVALTWGDTDAVISNTAMDFFELLEVWDYYYPNGFILPANTTVSVTFSVDVTTALFGSTYPIRAELNFAGFKVKGVS